MARFEDRANLAAERAAALAELTVQHHMLHQVVAWMAAHEPTPELAPTGRVGKPRAWKFHDREAV